MLPPLTDSASAPPTWRQRGRAWWQRALGPGGLPGAHGGDQTLLLSGLLLTLIALSVLAAGLMFFQIVLSGGDPLYMLVALAAGAVYGGAYAFNRQGRYQLAAMITAGIRVWPFGPHQLPCPVRP